jgi:large subunit ribosomal protein L1
MSEILEKIKEAKSKAKPRKFTQTWDLIISLKNIDLKKPENRINTDFTLPEGRGKEPKPIFIVDSLAPEAKKHAQIIRKDELDALSRDKKKLKKTVDEYDVWFAEAPLMTLVAKTLGSTLGPRNKMPRPIPVGGKIEPFLASASKVVKIRIRDAPVIQVPVGTEKLPEEKIARNAEAVYTFLKEKLPKGVANIKSVHIKLTMGPAIKVKM